MIWIVFWVLTQVLPMGCPQPVDPYGRTSQVQNLVACFSTSTITKEKHFFTKEEAEKFMEEGKKFCTECSGWELQKK